MENSRVLLVLFVVFIGKFAAFLEAVDCHSDFTVYPSIFVDSARRLYYSMTSSGIKSMWKRIYWKSFRGILRKILLISIVMNFAPGVDIMLLNSIFAISSPGCFDADIAFIFQLCPACCYSSPFLFSGHTLQQIQAYVAFLFARI